MPRDERKVVIAPVNADMVAQIVESVFVTMLDLEVYPDMTEWLPSDENLTSWVELSGEWEGAVLFECNRWQACQFTGNFLSMDAPSDVTDEVRDVLGELANMIGGNVKCAMANGLGLSMPSVSDGNDHRLPLRGFEMQERIAFLCALGPFWVTLLTAVREYSTSGRLARGE
jgi:chemotaxis protein CheX